MQQVDEEPAGAGPGNGCPPKVKRYKPAKPHVDLLEKKLWSDFCVVGNEMIVTKPGRRMFPTISVEISELDETAMYTVSLQFILTDEYRYKFVNGQWEVSGRSDIIHDESKMIIVHPSSPSLGEIWMKKPISFKTLKITHHSKSSKGNVS